ncbi:hypothetical protein CCAX7_64790 [Capsulimonas corticalis]|uniref:Uncharacterized protein n=1 Tax=Capsulimonas corticalis TaxID=2219043 RepID=A0A402CQV0_9BACT|nr:DUF3298 and DUF4163 domain-containing protein [Capsulimonas corticalis]BDI34428.1 hypothetical protein CCAX7_64790 [Capsulimonas corticalis]
MITSHRLASLTAAVAVLSCVAAATAQAPTKLRTIHASRAKRYEATCKYPVLRSNTPLAELANRTIAADVRKQQQAFVRMALQETAKEPPRNPYGFDASPMYQRYWFPRLYSVGMEFYEYTDGAHGNSYRVMYNFAEVDGKPQRMFLKDFFTNGSDYRKQVETKLMDKLHHDSRADFIGEVVQLSPTQLNRFVVEPDGLRFWFDPYEVAAYAQGPVDIKLTLAELGPDFKRSLLLAR